MYYDRLGVECNADPKEIAKAYRNSIKAADVKGRQMLNNAKFILNDIELRKSYDAGCLKYKTLDGQSKM